jgi:ubiquinone/menaquinone biosynthesis C-methylase UbiE
VRSRERFIRAATELTVRRPLLWPLVRRPMRSLFERLAPAWDDLRTPGALDAFRAALAVIDVSPSHALDLGTGTGAGAFEVARRWPATAVVGVDMADGMVERARSKTPPELRERVTFAVADAAHLPYDDESFDLVTLLNMVPFFEELRRVSRPGAFLVVSFSLGRDTPIWVPPERLRSDLERHGFGQLRELAAGSGTALLARRLESV